jgi:hypothetical protein
MSLLSKRMFEKFWANIIRYYTRQSPPARTNTPIKDLKPTEVGFVCVDAISNRLFKHPLKG